MRTLVTLGAIIAVVASVCFAGEVKNITSVQARALVAKEKNLVLLDVRTPEEYRQAHLRGALLIPLSELEQRVREVPRDKPLLVYCAIGARSVSAAEYLATRGYRNIYQISDGLVGWFKNGFPLER